MTDVQAYCVKCKAQRTMTAPQAEWMANGRPATRGTCPVCGTTLFRIGHTPAHDALPTPVIAAAKTTTKKPAAKKAPGTKKAAAAKKSAGAKKAPSTPATKIPTKAGQKAAKTAAVSKRAGTQVGKLVIVESPAKARSVGHFLGRGYTVKASKGHVRDLLVSRLSVDVRNNFEPEYRVMNDKRDVVKELTSDVARAQEVYLATDPDREGEAIAWHLIAAADMHDVPLRRVVFHEITEAAVQDAFNHPREIDMNLVNAQQARRILDRLVGYQITELLWTKVRNRLSAGRVQSIAVRMIVDREREIEAFVPVEYWTLDARLSKQQAKKDDRPFLARLVRIGTDEVNFGSVGAVTPHLDRLRRSEFTVADVKRGERTRKPSAPFTTSTLQQEASRRIGFNAGRTMSVAQQLYEGIDLGKDGATGLITYMRTDSLSVSPQAQAETRDYLIGRFGADYVPDKPPIYRTSAKGAQEAHEAIRPTSVLRHPDTLKGFLSSDQFKLYTLIWQRFVASQMANAVYNTLRVEIDASEPSLNTAATAAVPLVYHLRVSGSTIKFTGFLALYEDARDEDAAVDEDEGRIIPALTVGERLNLLDLLPEQHFTQPPPRYTEASLVRALEEFGIGRPSTYAPTVKVIQAKEYVVAEKKRLYPTETGRIVNDLLVRWFPDIMDYKFTAWMEDQLDEIAEGDLDWRPMLADFYKPFEHRLQTAREQIEPVKEETAIGRDCPTCSNPLVIRYGRFGKFIGCSDYPNCRYTEPFLEKLGVACPTCGKEHGGEIIVRRTKKGRTFYGCARYPQCDFTSWKRPLPDPCPNCGGTLVEQSRTAAVCLDCGEKTRITAADAEAETA